MTATRRRHNLSESAQYSLIRVRPTVVGEHLLIKTRCQGNMIKFWVSFPSKTSFLTRTEVVKGKGSRNLEYILVYLILSFLGPVHLKLALVLQDIYTNLHKIHTTMIKITLHASSYVHDLHDLPQLSTPVFY